MITHCEYKIEVAGLRYLFKTKEQMLSGGLRGYDKMSTLLINRGGI